ncbi:Choline transporter-like protein 5 [Durusdinium trenchii]|uniref:Choline transporter-like protein 5 n=1 Tax=Durusdinium trenchii TaxID=1381693 RepID=A0ABP0JFN8_9DINO
MWNEANLYFNEARDEMKQDDEMIQMNASMDDSDNTSTSAVREYVYSMAPDNDLKPAYEAIAGYVGTRADATTIKNVILDNFKFDALPLDVCPYSAYRCIPMPGVEFTELVTDSPYCTFKMSAEVIAGVGDALSGTFESLGLNAMGSSIMDTVGTWIGDFQNAIDAFCLVVLSSFIIGFIYMVSWTCVS